MEIPKARVRAGWERATTAEQLLTEQEKGNSERQEMALWEQPEEWSHTGPPLRRSPCPPDQVSPLHPGFLHCQGKGQGPDKHTCGDLHRETPADLKSRSLSFPIAAACVTLGSLLC